MELENAKEIVRLLADGIDPTTGEILPKESPYNDPVVIRALFSVIESLNDVPKPKKIIEQKQKILILEDREMRTFRGQMNL